MFEKYGLLGQDLSYKKYVEALVTLLGKAEVQEEMKCSLMSLGVYVWGLRKVSMCSNHCLGAGDMGVAFPLLACTTVV